MKTLGIILRRTNIGEADRILTIYTKEFGKIKAIAKGVRKINSRLAGNLEPYSMGEFMFHEGKTFETVIEAANIENNFCLSKDCKNFATAHYFGELIDKLTEENEKQPELFEIFRAAVSRLTGEESNVLVPFFEIKILDRLGFRPQVYYCLHCRKKLLDEQNYFSAEGGGVVCSSCKTGHLPKISVDVIKVFRLIIESDISLVDRLKVEPEIIDEMKKIIDIYQNQIIEREVRSKTILKTIENSVE
jgi:DNA repair protein RecO (recombination protein O)